MECMLTNERLDSLLYKKDIVVTKPIVTENVKDTLFWIFYKLFDVNYEKYPDFETESKIKFDLLSKFDTAFAAIGVLKSLHRLRDVDVSSISSYISLHT